LNAAGKREAREKSLVKCEQTPEDGRQSTIDGRFTGAAVEGGVDRSGKRMRSSREQIASVDKLAGFLSIF